MLNKKIIIKLTLFFTFLFATTIQMMAANQDVSATKAIQLFEEGEFEEALPLFRTLLEEKPDNPMLNYYYGASRTETGHFSENDLNHLLKAQEDEPPSKINYYLGMQYQAQNEWTKALRSYNQFQLKASDSERAELKVAEKIQQCFNQENPYTLLPAEETAIIEVTEKPVQERAQPEEISKLETVDQITSFDDSDTDKKVPANKPIKFPLNSNISYYNTSNFKSEEALQLFEKAEQLKNELSFSLNEMDQLRKEYRTITDPERKKTIGGRILAFENESYELRSEISHSLSKIRELENNYWQIASEQEVEAFQAKAERILAARSQEKAESEQEEVAENTKITIDPDLLLENTEATDLRAEAEKKEDELVYKIQIGAYSRGLPAYVERLYDKLSLIRKIDNYTDDEGVVVYTTGNLQNLEDAGKVRDQVRQEGVEDAFVVPYFKGKRITLEEAKKLETGS